jgi:hypothetical protein
MTRLLRLFPKAWQAAYGEEVADLLASSTQPWGDRLDLVRAAARVRTDQLNGGTIIMRALRVIAIGLLGLGLAGGGWAATQLTDGVVEIPMHWWSSLAVLPLPVGIVLAVLAWRPRRHRDRLA